MVIRIASGTQIDGFTVGERVHAGEMGALFRVTGRDIGFPMVMKAPRLGEGEDASGLLGFETEHVILPALQGPHVARFVASGAIAKVPYLVMEWIEGRSLAELVEGAPLPAEEVARHGAAIAEALHAIHLQDAVHHDVKPDNIILRPSGQAALIDFGLAHHARFPDLLAEEQRFLAGSAPYIAPEPVTGQRADLRSDLFSLGVVLYELATARLPFGVPRTLAGLRDRLWLDPVPPSAYAPVPSWLQEVILRCLEPDPSLRYPSAALIAFDLRNPEQVELTERARRSERPRFWKQAARWWDARHREPERRPIPNARSGDALIVLVAVDTVHDTDARHPALQREVAQVLAASPDVRLMFVSVVPVKIGARMQDSPQVENRVRLRSWVQPFRLPAHRHSLHVLESGDPAASLLDYARANLVDLIVLGAPGPSQLGLAWWRSIASTVTSHAHCSVHVVRAPDGEAEAA